MKLKTYKPLFIIGIVLVTVLAGTIFARSYLGDAVFILKYRNQPGFWSIYDALKENRDFIKKNPNNDSAYYSLGQGLYTIGAIDGAIDAFLNAVHISPKNDYYWSFLGRSYQAKKNYPNARYSYIKALEAGPDKVLNYTKLAWLYYFRLPGEEYKAYEVLKKGLEKFPLDKDILFDITRFYLYDKNEAEFRKYAPRYLKIDPTNELIKKAYENGFESIYGADKPAG